MRLDEPVGRGARDPVHLDRGGRVAAVIADGQGVELGDHLVPLVLTGQGSGGETVVPDGGALEIALVQGDPHDVVEAVQALAARLGERRLAEGLQRRKAGRAGALFDALGQLNPALARLHRGAGVARDGEPDEQQRDEDELHFGHVISVRRPTIARRPFHKL